MVRVLNEARHAEGMLPKGLRLTSARIGEGFAQVTPLTYNKRALGHVAGFPGDAGHHSNATNVHWGDGSGDPDRCQQEEVSRVLRKHSFPLAIRAAMTAVPAKEEQLLALLDGRVSELISRSLDKTVVDFRPYLTATRSGLEWFLLRNPDLARTYFRKHTSCVAPHDTDMTFERDGQYFVAGFHAGPVQRSGCAGRRRSCGGW